jgi:hypothetical protein
MITYQCGLTRDTQTHTWCFFATSDYASVFLFAKQIELRHDRRLCSFFRFDRSLSSSSKGHGTCGCLEVTSMMFFRSGMMAVSQTSAIMHRFGMLICVFRIVLIESINRVWYLPIMVYNEIGASSKEMQSSRLHQIKLIQKSLNGLIERQCENVTRYWHWIYDVADCRNIVILRRKMVDLPRRKIRHHLSNFLYTDVSRNDSIRKCTLFNCCEIVFRHRFVFG